MKSLLLTLLGTITLPATALAHSGHIADTGQGHAHWILYVLLGVALFGLAFWTRKPLARLTCTKRR